MEKERLIESLNRAGTSRRTSGVSALQATSIQGKSDFDNAAEHMLVDFRGCMAGISQRTGGTLATLLASVTSYKQKTPWKAGTGVPATDLGQMTRAPLVKSMSSNESSNNCTRYIFPAKETLLELDGESGSFRRSMAFWINWLLPAPLAPNMAKARQASSSCS